MRSLTVLLIVMGTLVFAGCGQKPTTVPDGAETESAEGAGTEGAPGEGQVGEGRDLPGASGAPGGGPAGVGNVIYFDFDRSDIRPEYASLINSHAKFLAGTSAIKIRVEGHTDERGSREYNIALAERRAQAVRRALMLQGAGDAQLTTVSYGEERPAVAGSDEASYEKNRRVELVYGR
ncbi:MAG: peptidoglycan-associated lipoprotein Pal [Steroidobacteraceae bacterium]